MNKKTSNSNSRVRRDKNTTTLSRGLERPFPTKRRLKCVAITDGAAQAAAASFAVIESRLMSLASLGFSGGTGTFTTSITGLLDSSAYALGRARKFNIKTSVVSAEATQIDSICLIFADTQPSTVITTYTLARAAAVSYLHTPIKRLPIVSGNSAYNMQVVDITAMQVLGDSSIIDDRDFICTLNPAPANSPQEIWAAFIVTSSTGLVNLVTGLSMTIELTVDYEAFSRLPGA